MAGTRAAVFSLLEGTHFGVTPYNSDAGVSRRLGNLILLSWITTALPIHHDDYRCQRRFALTPESSDEAVTTVDMRRRPCWGI